jgi:hypothetical protein
MEAVRLKDALHYSGCLWDVTLGRIATSQDSIRLWQLPTRSPEAVHLGRQEEPVPWRGKVI